MVCKNVKGACASHFCSKHTHISSPPLSSRSPTAAVAVSSTGAASGSEADYNPARSGYHPLEHACWERGQRWEEEEGEEEGEGWSYEYRYVESSRLRTEFLGCYVCLAV